MDRLQKKCLLASTGFHLSLLLILIVGPAFVVTHHKPDDMPILDFIPVKTVDALVSGGGNPKAQPPLAVAQPVAQPASEPKPLPPAPPPEPEKVRLPDPPKEIIKEVQPPKPEPDPLEPAKERKPRRPELVTTPMTRPKDTKADAKARERAQEEERAEAEAREYAKRVADRNRRARAALGDAANGIQEARAGSTTIELKGPGGGGVPYANFLQAVKSRYENAWIVPDGITDNDAVVAASVTIARDGTVVAWHVWRGSGNAAVDQSVRVTLQRVKFAAPLPEDAKENQRTVEINFSVAAKRGLG
jgi:TonB family protein